jgi:hypothetical protein
MISACSKASPSPQQSECRRYVDTNQTSKNKKRGEKENWDGYPAAVGKHVHSVLLLLAYALGSSMEHLMCFLGPAFRSRQLLLQTSS